MKTSNIDHETGVDAARGRKNTYVAGSRGITLRDASTEAHPVRDLTVVGGTITDNDDGTAVLTIGSSGGGGIAGSAPWVYAKADGGLIGDGATDDTVALQALIDLVYAAGGGVIFFEPGVYIIGGALRDTGAFNGQILLPDVSHTGDHIVLTFRGALRPGLHPVYGDTVPVATGLSVLKSTLTGASGTASCISGSNDTGSPSAGHGNNLEVNIEDLVCLAPDNPTFTFWNLSACQGGAIRALQISTPGGYAGSATQPTHSNAYGIKLPQKYFSNYTETTGLSVGGFYTCLLNGERADHRGLVLGICIVGIEQPDMFFASVIHSVQLTSFQYGIRASGGDSRLDIIDYSAEHTTSPSWQVTVYDLDDSSSRIYGYIRHQSAITGGTLDNTFTKNGGTNVLVEVKGPTWGAGASKHILLADGHATPFAFTDLLQMDDGSDFMWNDS